MILSKRGTGINNGWKVSILGNDAQPNLPARIFCYHVSGGASQDIMVSDTKFNINQWYNLVITYNHTTKTGKMYVNGILETQKENLAIPNASTDAPLFIGNDNPLLETNYFFHGKIDDIKIFNKALSPDEVYNLYNPDKDSLIAHYAFSGNTLDSSENKFDGINHGATLTTDRFGKENSAYFFNGIDNFIQVGQSIFIHL